MPPPPPRAEDVISKSSGRLGRSPSSKVSGAGSAARTPASLGPKARLGGGPARPRTSSCLAPQSPLWHYTHTRPTVGPCVPRHDTHPPPTGSPQHSTHPPNCHPPACCLQQQGGITEMASRSSDTQQQPDLRRDSADVGNEGLVTGISYSADVPDLVGSLRGSSSAKGIKRLFKF